ncbi:MAG: DUF2961 domain-containing protein [Candidatus Aminicenantes bacterium]|nr:DUF2961 domain-containing protein [Candidatus Aminicenantes bacterium]
MMRKTCLMIVVVLAGVACSAVAAEPTTLQDQIFPLIRLPIEFRARRANESLSLAKGESMELFRANGPGCVKHIWLTPFPAEANGILRIYADDAKEPQINMELQHFFGVLLDQKPYRVDSAAFVHLPQTTGSVQGAGYNCYLPIPFNKSCRITLEASTAFKGGLMVDWQQYPEGAEMTPYRLHAVYRAETPARHRSLYLMADISGRGFVAGIFKGIRQRDFSDLIYHTSGQTWLIDGETDPHVIRGNNEEDDFSFFWGYQAAMTPWIGCPYQRFPGAVESGRMEQDGVIYRFFGPDPVPFRSSLVLRCGARADDTETVVYYYRVLGSQAPAVRSPAQWQVTGPFRCPNYETFQRSEFPENHPGPWQGPLQGMAVHAAQAEHTWINFWPYYRGGESPEALGGHSAYARTTIDSDQDRPVQFRFGFDDWLSVWLNGEKLTSIRHDEDFNVVAIPAKLRKGPNELLIKSSNCSRTQAKTSNKQA